MKRPIRHRLYTSRSDLHLLLSSLSGLLLVLLLVAQPTQAAVPGYIQYSGRVTDGATASGTTTANLRVKLYTCACAHGDAACADTTNQCGEGDDGLLLPRNTNESHAPFPAHAICG